MPLLFGHRKASAAFSGVPDTAKPKDSKEAWVCNGVQLSIMFPVRLFERPSKVAGASLRRNFRVVI